MTNEIELEIAAGKQVGEYEVRVLRAVSGGEPREGLRLDVARILRMRPALESAVLASAAHARGGPVPELERPLRDAGQALFEGLFTGAIRETYRASVAVARERGEKLRVVLHLQAAELSGLPWEAMWDPEVRAYLCRKEPLVRHVPAPYTPDPLPVSPPMRILGLVASPRGLPPLDVDRERQHLDEALAAATADGRIHLEWLENATWDSLQDRLLSQPWHVLHFIGHGDYDPVLDQGRVALVNGEDGRADWVEAGRLVDLLNEADPTPRLVVLNSCSSGQSGMQDVLSGTAAALVNSGIAAVAAMQFRISDPAAVAFPRGFYKALAAGKSVDAALSSGRIAILGRGESLEWVTPVLYTRGDVSQLFSIRGAAPATVAQPTARAAQPALLVASAGPGQGVASAGPDQGVASAGPDQGEAAEAPPREVADDARYRRAQEAYRRGQWDEAVTLFERVHADHPDVEIPDLASARRKRELASWWARVEPSATPAAARLAEAGGQPPEVLIHPAGTTGAPPPDRPSEAPAEQPPAAQPNRPAPRPSATRRGPAVIATVVLLILVGVAGIWLLKPKGGGGTTGVVATSPADGTSPDTGASPDTGTSSSTRTASQSPISAAANVTAYTLGSQAAEVPLGGDVEVVVRVWNQPSTKREVGSATSGALIVTVSGPGIQIVAGQPDCTEPAAGSIRCRFGRLGFDKQTDFVVTLRGVTPGVVQVKTRAQAGDGQQSRGDTRDFTVVEPKCTVPNLIGMTWEVAAKSLKEAGLVPVAVGVEDGSASGLVIDQKPGAGESVGCGSQVEFRYSTIR